MSNFPKLRIDRLAFTKNQPHFTKQHPIVLILPILAIKLQKILSILNPNPMFLQNLLQNIQRNQPLIGIQNLPSLLILRPDRLLQVEPILITTLFCEFCFRELQGEVLVAVICVAVYLGSFFVYFF